MTWRAGSRRATPRVSPRCAPSSRAPARNADEAKARLQAAQARQASWDAERKRSTHQACLKRADAQLATASGPERFAASRFAESRLKRMLR